jgi:hypothetical protein
LSPLKAPKIPIGFKISDLSNIEKRKNSTSQGKLHKVKKVIPVNKVKYIKLKADSIEKTAQIPKPPLAK